MAGKNFEKLTIFMKIGIYEFLRSLIANPSSDSQNWKWRIQYGVHEFWKIYNFL